LKSKNANIFALKGSHEHSQVSAKSLKDLKSFLSNNNSKKQILWIFEKNIPIPALIKGWVKPQHKSIELDLMGNPFHPPSNPIALLIKEIENARLR